MNEPENSDHLTWEDMEKAVEALKKADALIEPSARYAQLVIKEPSALNGIADPFNTRGTSAIKWEQNGSWWGVWQDGYNFKHLAWAWFWSQVWIDVAAWWKKAHDFLRSFYDVAGSGDLRL